MVLLPNNLSLLVRENWLVASEKSGNFFHSDVRQPSLSVRHIPFPGLYPFSGAMERV